MFVPQTRKVFSLGALNRPSSPTQSGAQLRGLRSKAKFEKLESLYDFPEVLASREALERKVLQGSGSPGRLKKQDSQHPQSALIRDWLVIERRRADQAAEKEWKVHFILWQKEHLEKSAAEKERRKGGASMSHSHSAPLLPPAKKGPSPEDIFALQMELDQYQKETRELVGKEAQLEADLARYKEELWAEQNRRAETEKALQATVEERDVWVARANSHDETRKRLLAEQHDAALQVADLHQKLVSIGGALTVKSEG